MFIAVILISWGYWFLLWHASSMQIIFDAAGFESLGQQIHTQGWHTYFNLGPNREPLLPAVIAWAMGASEVLHVPYQKIVSLIQLGLLALTQLLLLRWFNVLKINVRVSAVIALYFAFSPAIVNSALSLFSEVYTYPLIVIVILLFARISKDEGRWDWLSAAGMAFAGIVLVLVKAVFEPVLILMLIVLTLVYLFKGQMKKALAVGLSFIILAGGVSAYKMLNYTGNGHFTVTNRSNFMLYCSAQRRAMPMNLKTWAAGLATIPGDGVCLKLFPPDLCKFWSFQTTDLFGAEYIRTMQTVGMADEVINDRLSSGTFDLIKEHPFKYVLGGVQEMMKMFFWESTNIGFVDYPSWHRHILGSKSAGNALRFIVSVCTILAFLMIAFDRRRFWPGKDREAVSVVLLLAWGVLVCFSTVSVLTRYAFCLIPIYLTAIALVADKLILKWKKPANWDIYFLAVTGAYILWRVKVLMHR